MVHFDGLKKRRRKKNRKQNVSTHTHSKAKCYIFHSNRSPEDQLCIYPHKNWMPFWCPSMTCGWIIEALLMNLTKSSFDFHLSKSLSTEPSPRRRRKHIFQVTGVNGTTEMVFVSFGYYFQKLVHTEYCISCRFICNESKMPRNKKKCWHFHCREILYRSVASCAAHLQQ